MSNPFESWTDAMLAAHNARVAARGRSRELSSPGGSPDTIQEVKTQPAATVEAKNGILGGVATTERHLHDQIMAFCDQQWPRWKVIHARTDTRSTIAVGCQDFTCFAPGQKAYLIECKKVGSKLTQEQLAWKKEMEMLGWEVHTVYSFQQFVDIVSGNIQKECVQQH